MSTKIVFNERWYMDASQTYWEKCTALSTNDVNNTSTESKLKAIRSIYSKEINEVVFEDTKEN